MCEGGRRFSAIRELHVRPESPTSPLRGRVREGEQHFENAVDFTPAQPSPIKGEGDFGAFG